MTNRKRKSEILSLYSTGMERVGIAERLGVPLREVCEVVNRHTRTSGCLKEAGFYKVDGNLITGKKD